MVGLLMHRSLKLWWLYTPAKQMRFITAYLTAIFLVLFGAAQFADHIGAKQCQERSGLTYDQCRQIKP